MPAIFWMFIAIALLWPLIKIWFFCMVALYAFMGFLLVLQGALKVALWFAERHQARLDAEAEQVMLEQPFITFTAEPQPAPKPKRRRHKKKVVNMIERNGVYVPENGEW